MSFLVGHTMTSQSQRVSDSLRLINKLGGNAIQITLGDCGERSVINLSPDDIILTKKILARGFYVVVHGKYIYNFCRNLEWQNKLLANELLQASKIDADVIIHQGKNLDELKLSKDMAHQTFVDNISNVLNSSNIKELRNYILLENSARQGTECGYSLSDLLDIYMRFKDRLRSRIGFCIDLCHIFVSGELDVTNINDVKEWFDRFNALIGFNKLRCIHFNDSKVEFNKARDAHESIGYGYIGKKSIEGFRYVCRLAKKYNIPLILETSSEYIGSEIDMLKSWSEIE